MRQILYWIRHLGPVVAQIQVFKLRQFRDHAYIFHIVGKKLKITELFAEPDGRDILKPSMAVRIGIILHQYKYLYLRHVFQETEIRNITVTQIKSDHIRTVFKILGVIIIKRTVAGPAYQCGECNRIRRYYPVLDPDVPDKPDLRMFILKRGVLIIR